jgi:hypothetical protein
MRAEPRRSLPAPVLQRIAHTAFPGCRVLSSEPLGDGAAGPGSTLPVWMFITPGSLAAAKRRMALNLLTASSSR